MHHFWVALLSDLAFCCLLAAFILLAYLLVKLVRQQ